MPSLAVLLLAVSIAAQAPIPSADVAIVRATIVDVSDAGRAKSDIEDSVVLISRGRIVEVGDRRHVRLPPHAHVVDAKGAFLIPGLIDAYGAMRNAHFADAYLYEGVTTVMVPLAPGDAMVDGETTVFRPAAGPSLVTSTPISGYSTNGDISHAHPWTAHRTEDQRASITTLKTEIANAAAQGSQVVAVDQDVWPDQLDAIVAEAHRLGLAVSAQPAFTTYPYAVHAGVDVFTRNDRYTLAATRAQDFLAYSDDPAGPGSRPAARAVCQADVLGTRIDDFAVQLAGARTALMPILSMEATADDVGGPNPWSLRSSIFVTPADLDSPVDPKTGARPYLEQHPATDRARVQACARSKQSIDRRLHAGGAIYVAGTSAPSYGVMPGGGLHEELHRLGEIGLTPREALAAATSNAADALRLSDRGRIEVGRRADLVVLSADPRVDIGAVDAIREVLIEGRRVDRDALMANAKKAQRSHH